MAVLIFFAATAGAGFVAANLLDGDRLLLGRRVAVDLLDDLFEEPEGLHLVLDERVVEISKWMDSPLRRCSLTRSVIFSHHEKKFQKL